MKYIESRHLTAASLRRLCIKHDWYTCGTNREYDALFEKLYNENGCYVHIDTDKLYEIASDIYIHSEIEYYTVTTIMSELARACSYVYERP